jgi:hypothetical protein
MKVALAVCIIFFGHTPLMAQGSSGGFQEDSMIYETNSTDFRVQISFDAIAVPDSIAVYYPPRPGGKRVHNWSGSGINNVDVNCSGKGTKFEVVVNEGSNADPGTYWDYNGTVTPKGGKPFPIKGTPGMGSRGRPKVSSKGGIFNNGGTNMGGGGRSSAGIPKARGGRGGPGGNLNPAKPKKRTGFVTRIISPAPGVKIPKASTTRAPSPNPNGSGSYPGQVPKSAQNPKVLFSGKGSMTTYIRKIPTRSVRRVVLRGGRAR